MPPTGMELLKANGTVIRPEQRSVKLLRGIILLFAPKPMDVVDDLFAGTMSTAVAALL
jgi:DNA modification methylase